MIAAPEATRYARRMLKLIIGNKAYSSWSMRGWLAMRQSGLPFEEMVVPLYDDSWSDRRTDDQFAPSNGKVPILWDGDVVVWESIAIIDWLADKAGADKFWPAEDAARAMARSIAAEMHAGFSDLRRECPTNFRQRYMPRPLSPEATRDVNRILTLWAQARARFGGTGPFLFGAFGAADIMYAPVVSRLVTYSIGLPPFAQAYVEAVTAHPFYQDWLAGAQEEDWVIEKFELPVA